MSRIPHTYAWAASLTALAVLLAGGNAYAQSDRDDQSQRSSDDRRTSSDDDEDRDESRRQSDDEADDEDRNQTRSQSDQYDRDQARRQQSDLGRNQADTQRSPQDRPQSQTQQRQTSQQGQYQQGQYSQQRQTGQQQNWDARQRQQGRLALPPPNEQLDRQQYGQQYSDERFQSGTAQWSQEQPGSQQEQGGLGVHIVGDGREGVLVNQVFRNSPAEQMGLQRGDRITHLNGQRVQSEQSFVSQIRNTNPGEEIELDVLRNRQERTVRGELETRQEALVIRSQQQRGQSWQAGYDSGSRGGYDQQAFSSGQGGDIHSRLDSIERQVDRLIRELDEIRFSLDRAQQGSPQAGSRQWNQETTASYDEYQPQRGSQQWQRENYQSGQQGQFDSRAGQQGQQFESRSGQQWDRGQQQYDQGRSGIQQQYDQGRTGTQQQYQGRSSSDLEYDASPGGDTGGARTRPGEDRFDRN